MRDAFTVGDWHVVPATGQVSSNNTELRLEPKAMAVLVYLSEHAGEIVTRQDLEDSVWKDTIVTYEALTVTINKIRAAFGDDSRKPRYIETLAKRGYRLIAPTSLQQNTELPVASIPTSKPHQRYQHLTLYSIIAVLIITASLFFYLREPKEPQLPLPEGIPSIAVIPFTNISGDPKQDYFAYGMTEYLITDLSRLSSLMVTSRTSVLGFNSQNVDIKKTSLALNVRYLLTGSVSKYENRMRVAVQLTDALNGMQLWADRFDRKLDDLFAMQDEITTRIVKELVKQVGHNEQELLSHNYTSNPQAHDYFIRGNALYTSISKEGNTLAREMFLKAIDLDANFASAYGAIALTYVDDYRRKWVNDPNGAVDRAFEYANKAIAIDKNAAVAYVVQAYAYLYGRKEPEKAITSARKAISLYPNYADAYAIIGSAYSFVTRSEDAIRVNHHAMRLNPTSSFIYYSNLGRDYYFLNQHDKAIDSLENAIFRNENYLNAHLYLAATYANLNKMEDASWEVQKVQVLDPEFSLKYWASTQPYRSKERLDRMVNDLRKAGFTY